MDIIDNELKSLLMEGATYYDIDLNNGQLDKFFKYKKILKEWNEKINLTAIEEDKEIILKHFIDSMSIAKYYKNSDSKIIDVGTGAGFPGIVLKVVLPQLKVTLLDSLDKRVRFLNEVIQELDLEDIEAIHGRAEDKGMDSGYREKFDFACARAVANLPVLLEYCLPFVKVGGYFIAMKGSSTDEVDNSKKALDLLGGIIEEVKEFELPFCNIKRSVIVVRKFRQTSTRYPRKAGKPSKDPLI
ncbi:MAG: 16S rRNA (guanine(527)-N(7))-methyltransferase RsmG [Clostridiaceae bacterium]|nr:16S rRNA (guanine(527)-N(7))-methyltransferase RsmG [Clostridiaceae bacterium]